MTFGGKYIYYHISPGYNVESILNDGLIPENRRIYLADTIWTCEALTPIFNGIHVAQSSINQITPEYPRKTVYAEFAVFGVNMEGLEDKLWPEPVDMNFYVEKYRGVYTQYIYRERIAPDRIWLEYRGLLQAAILEHSELEGFYDREHFDSDGYRVTVVE